MHQPHAATAYSPLLAREGIERLWRLKADFGRERSAREVYLDEVVSDRYALVYGLQLIRDELQLVPRKPEKQAATFNSSRCDCYDEYGEAITLSLAREPLHDLPACSPDWRLPSVCVTLAHTNCGDRIHQGEDKALYDSIVASRFATLSERGGFKVEDFAPPGGGTDHGATLASVTVGHQLDRELKDLLYTNNQSFALIAMDLQTHCGCIEDSSGRKLGQAREASWRESRPACGAIAGALEEYVRGYPCPGVPSASNTESLPERVSRWKTTKSAGPYPTSNFIHQRLWKDLQGDGRGRGFFNWLKDKVQVDGEELTFSEDVSLIASCIVAVQGLYATLAGLCAQAPFQPTVAGTDIGRGVAHLTASVMINRSGQEDTLIYLARATILEGEVLVQGFGVRPERYLLLPRKGETGRLILQYDGATGTCLPEPEQRHSADLLRTYHFRA